MLFKFIYYICFVVFVAGLLQLRHFILSYQCGAATSNLMGFFYFINYGNKAI